MERTNVNPESIFTLVSDAILVIDEQGFVVAANPASVKMIGCSTEELIGKVHFCSICTGMATSREEASCTDCFANKWNVPSFEMKIRTKGGSEYPVAASSTCLLTPSGKQVIVIMRDMSQQQKAEGERFQRQMINYVIQAQEEERKRVSRDLHDGVGQALYSILVGLKVLDQFHLEHDVKEQLENVWKLTTHALNEVKNMAVELRPSTLEDFGFLPTLRSYRKRYEQQYGIEMRLATKGHKRRYASIVETALYRICQEATINAAKYSGTSLIDIEMEDSDGTVMLTIRDYGQGFDPEQFLSQGSGLGLYGMKERAGLLGGTVAIHSVPGKGTTVQVIIPLTEKGEPRNVDPDTHSG